MKYDSNVLLMLFILYSFIGRKKDLFIYGLVGSGVFVVGGDDDDDDDDIDFFGFDDEDVKVERERRFVEYVVKKVKS